MYRCKQLVWNATSSSDLSGYPDKNAKKLDKDVHAMFKRYPSKATSMNCEASVSGRSPRGELPPRRAADLSG
jgi:hypothetical protein